MHSIGIRTFTLRILLFLVISLTPTLSIFSQEILKRNYILKDGLPSNETYHIITDKKGYIWIATDAGICKYDGYKFKVFGEKDGLPESVVLKLYEDRKGRIWFSTLSSRLGYIFENKIHLIIDCIPHNTTFIPYVYSFHVDNKDNLWVGTIQTGSIFKIPYPYKTKKQIEKSSNVVLNFHEKGGGNQLIYCSYLGTKIHNHTLVSFKERSIKQSCLYSFSHSLIDTISAIKYYIKDKQNNLFYIQNNSIALLKNKKLLLLKKFKDRIISATFDKKQQLWIGFVNSGVICCPDILKNSSSYKQIIKDVSITSFAEDKDGGLWFSSLEKGIFYIPGIGFKSIGSKDDLLGKKINSIAFMPHNIVLAQEALGSLFIIKSKKIDAIPCNKMSVFYDKRKANKIFLGGTHPAYMDVNTLKTTPILGTNQLDYYARNYTIDKEGNIYTFYPTLLLKLTKSLHFQPILKTINRINDVNYDCKEKRFWIATNAGLITYKIGSKIEQLKNRIKKLSTRVDKIAEDRSGKLWLATRGSGIYIFDKKKKLKIINEKNGLASNFCRTIHIDSLNNIWVGTNAGLSLISETDNKVYNFSFLNEIVSGEINDIGRSGDNLWVATAQGLYNYYIPELIAINIKTPIYITNVETQFSNKIKSNSNLPYQENFLKFSFVGLSYYQAGKITYSYKLSSKSLDDQIWRKTNDLSVEYFNLAPGNYIFEVKATSHSHNINNPSTFFHFTIQPPFWKTWWFTFLLFTILFGSIYLFFRYKIIQIRKKEKEKAKTQILFAQLESKVLKAQMSPHFIFNALNSIQNFILKNENRDAHEYLSKFARLMRNILEGSDTEFIPLQKEIETLTLYIQLEKMRASDKFDFQFIISDEISPTNLFIPAMILQPFIENAILHGLFPKTTANGLLKITFNKIESQISCLIEDNGIGRKSAKEINDKKQQYHKSMGMSVTNDRIEKLKKINNLKAEYTIIDLFDANGNSAGTKVQLILPIKISN